MSNAKNFLKKLMGKYAVAGAFGHDTAPNKPSVATVQPVGSLEEPNLHGIEVNTAAQGAKTRNMESDEKFRSGPKATAGDAAQAAAAAAAAQPRIAAPRRFQESVSHTARPTDAGTSQAVHLYAKTNYFMDNRPEVVQQTQARYLKAFARWLRDKGLMTAHGMAITDGGIGDDVILTSDMLSPAGKVLMTKHYPAWAKAGKPGRIPSLLEFDRALPKVQEAVLRVAAKG